MTMATTTTNVCEACSNDTCEQMAVGPRHIAPDSYFCCTCQGYSTPRDQCDACRPSVEDDPEAYGGRLP